MSFFGFMQELYKYFVKGQAPGEAYVERLPFNLQNRFNSSTTQARANVAKAAMALVSVASLGAYLLGPSVVAALSSSHDETPALKRKDKESSDEAIPAVA